MKYWYLFTSLIHQQVQAIENAQFLSNLINNFNQANGLFDLEVVEGSASEPNQSEGQEKWREAEYTDDELFETLKETYARDCPANYQHFCQLMIDGMEGKYKSLGWIIDQVETLSKLRYYTEEKKKEEARLEALKAEEDRIEKLRAEAEATGEVFNEELYRLELMPLELADGVTRNLKDPPPPLRNF